MSDPRTVREVNFVVDGVKQALDGRITLLQYMVGAGLTILVAIAGAGTATSIAIYREIGSLDTKVSTFQESMKGVIERINAMNSSFGQQAQSQQRMAQTLERIENKISQTPPRDPVVSQPPPPITLTSDETVTLRSFFSIAKKSDEPPKYKLGTQVPESDLKAMPTSAAEKVSQKLRGTKYLFDPNGSLVVTGEGNYVVLIVAPA